MDNLGLPPTLTIDRVNDVIRKAIVPFVGDTMARASIDALSRKMGIAGPETTGEQVAALVDKLGQGLVVFVGRDKAGQVQGEILRALAAQWRSQ